MGKRPFARRRGELHDTYEEYGRTCMAILPQSFLEPLSAEQRARALERVATADGGGNFALMEDKSPEYVEQLLKGLEEGNIAAPMSLSAFAEDDARIRPALIRAAARVPAERLANFVQVVGLVGGEGAIATLTTRLDELAVSGELMKDDPFFNSVAGALASTAQSLLALDVQNVPAAEQLVRVMREHPVAFNRRSAAMNAADVFPRFVRTTAMSKLRAAFLEVFGSADDELVLAASRALIKIDAKRARQRITAILQGGTMDLRERAADSLLNSDAWWMSLEDVLTWLRTTASPRVRLTYARMLKAILGDEEFERIHAEALNSESPSLRLIAVRSLEALTVENRRKLASAALADEPDEGLRSRLQQLVGD